MIAALRRFALQALKIPAEPIAPAGSHTSLRVFRAARNFYRLLLLRWVLKQVGVVAGALVGLHFLGQWTANMNPTVAFWIRTAEWVGLAGVVVQAPFTLMLVRFDYEMRWYIVTDRSLRIRTGLWDIREMTMTFANIQQITVEQGPLQRLLGLADVLVRTAGGGAGGEHEAQQKGQHQLMHLGFFHGVDNAEEIRDLIQDRMRLLRGGGLGDPDDHDAAALTGAKERSASPTVFRLNEAIAEFAREAQALRGAAVLS
jgi:membrane protein YdbS with pleckstrin-like domain